MKPTLFSAPPISWRAGAATAVLLAAFSCAGPKFPGQGDSMAGVPTRWQGASSARPLDTASLQNWWTRFRDPVLSELVTGALRTSTDMRTALARIEESRARRGAERAQLFPTLSGGVSGRGSRTKNQDTGLSVGSESYNLSLDASWQTDLFGVQRQSVHAATADLAQAEENFYGAQVSLAAEVATAYVSLRSAEARLAVVRRTLGTRSETVQLAQWRELAGTGTALDTQQSISTLEQARAAIPSLQQTIAQTRNQLALLSGWPPGALNALLGRPRGVPEVPPRIALGIPAETLRQRPDVRAAERAIEAAVARTRSAERQRFPSLSLSGSLGMEALSGGRLFSPQQLASSIAGSLTAPIFDAGRIQQNINLQNAAQKQVLIAWESTVLTALSEVENALIAIQRTAERLAILETATASARIAATLANQQYAAGQADIQTVLEAQRTLLSLEEQQVSTTADQTTAHIQLYRALGGGWSKL